MEINNHINYVEFYSPDLQIVKRFYSQVFEWVFTDFGLRYTSFSESGIAGGFELSDKPITKGALVILYHSELENIREKIKTAGGSIVQDIFSFPGGKRFHFEDPVGNELAVWTETN
ncbi:VOC family protein [Flavobacteriaceae bacterium]|nr:VOC family protein [Flavobacteriaceae bacterium]